MHSRLISATNFDPSVLYRGYRIVVGAGSALFDYESASGLNSHSTAGLRISLP